MPRQPCLQDHFFLMPRLQDRYSAPRLQLHPRRIRLAQQRPRARYRPYLRPTFFLTPQLLSQRARRLRVTTSALRPQTSRPCPSIFLLSRCSSHINTVPEIYLRLHLCLCRLVGLKLLFLRPRPPNIQARAYLRVDAATALFLLPHSKDARPTAAARTASSYPITQSRSACWAPSAAASPTSQATTA